MLNLFTLRETEINKEREIMEKYRIKYGIKLGEWGGNNMLGNKADKEKSKVKELVVNKKM